MEHFRLIGNTNEANFIYCILDTCEGSSYAGHWMSECAIFLPFLKQIQNNFSLPIKILLANKKRYKLNVLTDFGFYENDIVYIDNFTNHPYFIYKHVIPHDDSKYIALLPNFIPAIELNIQSSVWFQQLEVFLNYYNIHPQEKTIPILFLRRSKKENTGGNSRKFINLDDVNQMLIRNNVCILDIDLLSSLHPQIELVRKSKLLIMEMGSSFNINASWFAKDSHILIINDFCNINREFHEIEGFMQQALKSVKEHNNTYEVFNTNFHSLNSFWVDVDILERRILGNTWTDHDAMFKKFILENTKHTLFLEIGNIDNESSSIFSNNLQNWKKFEYSYQPAVISSHVIERLHDSLNFLQKMKENEVPEIFISISNMDVYLCEKILTTGVYIQEKCFYDFYHILRIFYLYNYKCSLFFQYDGNVRSFFYKFVYEKSMIPITLPTLDAKEIVNMYTNEINSISELILPENSFIYPSGIYAQYLYFRIKNKENIVGFIGKSPEDCNTMLYGTGKLVFTFAGIDLTNITVIVCNCPNKQELLGELETLYPSIQKIVL